MEHNQTLNLNDANKKKMMTSPTLKRTLLVLVNFTLMALGSTGGPLVSRLYFLHGGHRRWLSSSLQTAGFPIILLPLFLSSSSSFFSITITPQLFLASAALGLLIGLDDFLYAYGLSFLPVSTSALLLASQLAFTALFAFLIVRQRFTAFSVNAVVMLTVGAVVLGLRAGGDRPDGVGRREYWGGFGATVAAAVLYGFLLPLVELAYRKAGKVVTYGLVMEMQMVMGFFATVFSLVGMVVNGDFKAIPKEAKNFGLGEAKYYTVLVWTAIFWQCFFLGTVGVIFCVNTLLAGIIIAVFIPVVEVLGVVFFHEKFSSDKGVALALSLWGLASYSYGEYLDNKEKTRKEAQELGLVPAQIT